MTVNHKLLRKLAFTNIKTNHKTLVPFLIASALTVMIFYILSSLSFCPYIYLNKIEAFKGAQTIAIFLEFGSYIVGVFSVIFILYANNFVMKERRREIGLYGILGLSKKNILMLLGIETLMYAFVSILTGILLGTVLNKIMLLFLYKTIGQATINGFFISTRALARSLILFGIIFTICLAYNVSTISLGNPIELLRSNKMGEKEPQVKWITLVVGIVTTAFGYYIALSTKSTMSAVEYFLAAALLVMAGTYCLFTSGSIFLLKVLKNNKNYYYKTKHYISVSNLLYRMKHNAAGLASICILSTGVIILMTCASSLMALGEKNLALQFPMDVMISAKGVEADDKLNYFNDMIKILEKNDVDYQDARVYGYLHTMTANTPGSLLKVDIINVEKIDDIATAYLFSQDTYNLVEEENITLAENEILYYSSSIPQGDTIRIGQRDFKIVGSLKTDKIKEIKDISMSLFSDAFIVFCDIDVMREIFYNLEIEGMGYDGSYEILTGFNLKSDLTEEQIAAIRGNLSENPATQKISFVEEDRNFFYNTYGGAFFVGVFLAILFVMATVLIIYYKQMSEGLEDRERYSILKNVGLTDKEVRATIKNQVMILFFLPVVTSIIHMIVASNIVRLFLGTILLVDGPTFALTIAIVSLIFLLLYGIVYKITSREYYHLVNN